ncbi:MAG: carboxypeptidase-like regulatory domain-containing protein, partial [Gemmatimonadaceae bacterium]
MLCRLVPPCVRQPRQLVRIIALAVVAGSATEAQRLTGRVLESDGATPAPWVALLVVDSTGNAIARGQTTVTGSFAIDVPAVGRYSVRALRVGFRPTVTPLLLVAAGPPTTVQVQLTGQRVELPTVRVRDRSTCQSTLAGGDALVDTWDQARAALLGVMHNEGASDLSFAIVNWVVENDVWPDTGTKRFIDEPRPSRGAGFRSRPARELLRDGFVQSVADSVEFHAPDALVLLDPEFAASYCFWLEPAPPHHPDWVGLGVYSAQTTVGRVSVEGVLWLTRDGALVRFDYRYVGLDQVLEPAQPGGRVEFLRLPSGQWIVSRWGIRMPQLVTEMQSLG